MANSDDKVGTLVFQAFQNWKMNDPKLECVMRMPNGDEPLVPHHNPDGSLKHYCTPSFCPDIHGRNS